MIPEFEPTFDRIVRNLEVTTLGQSKVVGMAALEHVAEQAWLAGRQHEVAAMRESLLSFENDQAE